MREASRTFYWWLKLLVTLVYAQDSGRTVIRPNDDPHSSGPLWRTFDVYATSGLWLYIYIICIHTYIHTYIKRSFSYTYTLYIYIVWYLSLACS